MADSSEPAFLFLYRKEAVAPVDYLSTFATAPFLPFITLNMFGLLILGQNIIENHYHGQLASNRLRQFKHFKE